MNLSNIATQTYIPNFELLQAPVAKDENVQKIYDLPDILSERGKEAYLGQAKDADMIGELLMQIQSLTTQLTAMQQEQSKAYDTLSETHEQTLQQLSLLQQRMDAYDRSIIDRVSERMAALGNGFTNLKAGMKDHAADFVLDFRVNGKETSARALELFDVEGKLQWMRGCISNGIYELEKSINKQQKLAQTYNEVYSKTEQALYDAGKDDSMLKHMAESQRDMAMRKSTVFQALLQKFQSFGNHLDNMMNRIGDYVKDAHHAKDVRTADKLQQNERDDARADAYAAFKDGPELE